MLAAGASLLAAAHLAGAAPAKKGGIFKFGTSGASVQIDPQVSYITTGWWLEYATAAKLYNWSPGAKLVPEVASRFVVSNGGRRYTFFIRRGFRFSDGTPVTAASFKYAINRAANHDLASPGAQFITDPNGLEIVGARYVNDGRGTDVSGVRARGNRLIVDLARPEPRLLYFLAMPFFQATSTVLPLDREVVDVRSFGDLPSAGPYAFALNDVNRTTQLRRNPYWRPGAGRTAPRNLAGLDVYWNLNEQVAFERVKSGELDEGPIPAAEVQGVANQYGVNRSRFWAKAGLCIGLVAFNNSSGLFHGNAAMRRAVNWALDRSDYLGGAPLYSRTPWTHILPPSFPGSIVDRRLQPYAPTARVEKARRIAAGHFRDGTITVYYRSSGTGFPAQAQIVRRDLVNLGFEPANITMRGFTGGNIYDAFARRGSDGDLAVSLGACLDFSADLDSFLPFGIGPPWFPNSPKYRAKIAAANRLSGNARLRALGKLDLEIMRNVAPFAVMNVFRNRFFFSDRVDPSSLRYHRVYQDWSIPALALK
jgi:ABC-type transport system substrate-binding protein